MNSTSRLDQIIARLRQQLTSSYASSQSRRSVDERRVRSPEPNAPQLHKGSALSAVKALRDAGVSDERALVKRYIEGVFAHELNGRILNDPEFQHSLTNLLSMLEDDHEAWSTCVARIRE